MAKKKQINNFLSVLKKYALEDFNITENSSPLLKELAKLEISDPIEEMEWHSTNIKNKLGDPFELINKTIDIEDIDRWNKYVNEVIPAFQNTGHDTYKQLAANISIDLNDAEIKEMASALASMEIKMSAYNEDISLYQQQIQGLKNKNKYKNKDIMNEIEAQKLIEESNRIKDSIPKRGDQYYDSKRKRQYVYEGPDETFEGMHSFISDQGRTFVGSLDDLEKFTDESRFLNIDDLSEYRNAIDDLDIFLGDIRHGSKSMEDGFWDRAQKAVRRVNKAESKVKKKIKYHRMENDAYKTKKVLQGYINDWKQKHTQQNTSQSETMQRRRRRGNVEHRSHAAPRTNKKPFKRGTGKYRVQDDMPIPIDYGASFHMDWLPNSPLDHVEKMGDSDVWTPETPEEMINYAPPIIEDTLANDYIDMGEEFIANLSDEQIENAANSAEEYNKLKYMRKDAREKLGMEPLPEVEPGKNTGINTNLNNNFRGNTNQTKQQPKVEETIEEKIKRLTEEERQRFERESQADFNKSMEEIEAEFNQEAERIENEFGPAKYDLDDTSLHLDSPDVKARKQRLENTGKRLSNNKGPNGTKKRFTGQRVANNSKRSIKKRKLSGKKFKVKGGNLKQAAANTFVNIATDTVRETISKNADELKNFGRHPNMFEFDEFADLTDADIDFYYDNLFGMDVKTKQQMKKSWIEKRKLAKTARESAKKRKIIDNFDDYMDNFFSYNGYSSVEGQARFNPDPEVGWDETDFKNPDSYNRHRIDFEVDDDGNLKFKRYDEMETVEIEQNKPRRTKGDIGDDDIFGWMKKHKIGLGEALNVLGTVSAYKDARKQGHSVGSSIVRAAGSFVMGEMLGFWGSMGWELAKGIPKAAIKGAEVLYKENRRMNSAANQYGLGGDFQDTQQLATMRQSGMEMAKMAQYNLQQTLMGNEATYLHR